MNDEVTILDNLIKKFGIVLAIIITIGMIMVWSSSYIFSAEYYGTPYHFITRQLIYLVLALTMMFAISQSKYTFWIKYGPIINILATSVLAFTLLKSFGSSVKGATRWLSIGGFSFQPGELVKITVILSSLMFFEKWNKMTTKEKVKHGLTILLPMGLLLKQPDFGTFFICFVAICFVCFLSSFPRKYFYYSMLAGSVGGVLILISQAYRVKRLLTYLDPWKNAQGSGFQIIQSYLAFANGSTFGQGLGNSNEKLFYLPEAHNDFIFSVIGEELGFIGVMVIIFLFIMFMYYGFRLALQVKDRMGLIVAAAIVFVLGLQALLNMGVVLGLLPTKGLNLPFISYGGSSLICNFFGVGLLLSVIRGYRKQISATEEETVSSKKTKNTFEQSEVYN